MYQRIREAIKFKAKSEQNQDERTVPYCHKKGPFSCRRPSSDEQPGPPFSQMVISSSAAGLVDGKNQKYNFRSSVFLSEIGNKPA